MARPPDFRRVSPFAAKGLVSGRTNLHSIWDGYLAERAISTPPGGPGGLLGTISAEQRMEGPEDSLGLFPGYKECLMQWKYSLAAFYPGRRMEFEWFRHNRQCATLWVPGNVSSIRHTTGVDYRWYSGESPIDSPRQ